MSRLDPSVIALDKGLNLQTAKIMAPAGSVLSTLNYEQVDFQGLKRIDGYARYDGSRVADLSNLYVIGIVAGGGGPWSGRLIVKEDRPESVIGVAVGSTATSFYMAVIAETLLPKAGDKLAFYNDGVQEGTLTVDYVSTDLEEFSQTDEQLLALRDANNILRQAADDLPGRIAGLHWFQDRLYAVADTVVVPASSFPQSAPNTTVVYNGYPVRVLDIIGPNIYLDTVKGENIDPYPDTGVASFFESRTEQQALDEDGVSGGQGWRFNHLGWKVAFKEGESLFGSLPSLNQNLKDVGIQGPTSVTGDNGAPTFLSQGVSVGSQQVQVNGWKSSTIRTDYTLLPELIKRVDDTYIYADAFFSWADGTITSPSHDDVTLVQRSAVNTVTVEI